MTKHFSTGSFVAGVMFGALLAGAWFFNNNTSFLSLPPALSLATSTTSNAPVSGTVSVTDQPSGDTVVVESVTVPPPGVWVAVREMQGDNLGNVLGAARASGPRSNLSVPLLRATEPGRSYAVELYRDDDNGAFDPSVNSVYVDFTTGSRVVAYFATAN